MRALKLAGAAIAAVVVVIALLLVIGLPVSFLTSTIQERVERETGYKLAINGGAKIGLWPSLNVTLNDVLLQDPKDRDIKNRLTAGIIQADMTLASVWAGHPEISELRIDRPVLTLPLQRERVRETNPSAKFTSSANAFSIGHVSVTGGTLVFANLRDRVENRIETINADAIIGSDRKITMSGNARASGEPLNFELKATAPAAPIERQNIPTELTFEAPGLLQGPLSARAEVRLNGSVVMINGVTGTLGDNAFNGWASVDVASKPLVKLDLDFQRLAIATSPNRTGSASQPWSNAAIDLNGLNYVDAQARISAAELNIGDGRFAPAAIDAALASGVLKVQLGNLGAYD
ncbi:MAG: AsmA family protein, partial [Bradyrhizobium sp.]